MTATLSPLNSADTPSPIYPDRLIRPLPKRPLRSRLSSDTADSIFYPPAPQASQLFYSPGGPEDKEYAQVYDDEPHDHADHDNHYPRENGVDVESGDEDAPVVVRRNNRRSSASSAPQDGPVKSGPDGYDAFENTNNKKKRKIPTPGTLGHHSALSGEFADMSLGSTPPATPNDAAGTYYGTGNPASPVGAGMSGPGRGRLGRHTGRSGSGKPLSVNNWTNSRPTSRRDGLTGDAKSDPGIISTAIANAAALSPSQGADNVSLLEKENTTPTKTQFTFTCESDSSKGMAMQGRPYPQQRSPTSPLAPNRVSTQATQTSPNMPQANQQAQGQPATRKKKRSPKSVYALAARQRRVQQQYTNLHHPPSLGDIWICEFCEYESIFGRPPEALIRQYEIKDRQERKRQAEKKRLLEKAKMRGRKNKKALKGGKNAQHHHHHGCEHHHGCDHHHGHDHHHDHGCDHGCDHGHDHGCDHGYEHTCDHHYDPHTCDHHHDYDHHHCDHDYDHDHGYDDHVCDHYDDGYECHHTCDHDHVEGAHEDDYIDEYDKPAPPAFKAPLPPGSKAPAAPTAKGAVAGTAGTATGTSRPP